MRLFSLNIILFLNVLLISNASYCQLESRIGFDLIFHLDSIEDNEKVPLLIEARNEQSKDLIRDLGGSIHLELNNLYSIEIEASKIKELEKSSHIKTIEYNNYLPRSMGDTMLIQTNMDSVIRMFNPIRTEFTGKGVLLGVIDSGIELDHPDFKDSTGKSRVLYIWDQAVAYDPNRKAGKYNYGVEWDSVAINQNISTHDDRASEFGHGSMVTGAAASNGLASGHFRGIAPEVKIISVATDFNRNNWLQSVAEAVDYIYNKADSLNMPCVINASIGTYVGSHDGKDIAARMIDQMIKAKNGRAFVCAAGNAGAFNFHLQHNLQNDTNFTWFDYSPAQFSSQGGVYFEAWADTNDLKNVSFSIGADDLQGLTYSFRGRTSFDSISNRLNVVYPDSIIGSNQNKIADVLSYAELSQGRYRLTFAIPAPDSSQYKFRFETRGSGKLDIWSNTSLTGTSNILSTNLPPLSSKAEMIYYKKADSLQTIVSSFSCLPSIVTVGNYINRNTYLDVNNIVQNMGATPGEISTNSSLGPNRDGYLKPDISSAGDFMLSAGRIATMNATISSQPSKIAFDSLHMRNGGTSMASPTVAGMLCLYLQQCKNVNSTQIKSDLIASAKKDIFTSNSVGPKWGHGKADAFQFLRRNAKQANIISPSSIFCIGDTVNLSINGPFNRYHWNIGDTTNFIEVDSSGVYYARVSDSNSCINNTDTIVAQFNQRPTKPNLFLSNDSIIGDKSGNYDWYFNGILQNGFNDSIFIATQTGDYFAIYSDSTMCEVTTDTINYLITSTDNKNYNPRIIFPNPNNGEFTLQSNELISDVTLYNLSGKKVFSKRNIQKQLIDLKMGPIKSGIYIIELRYNSNKLERFKLVINI